MRKKIAVIFLACVFCFAMMSCSAESNDGKQEGEQAQKFKTLDLFTAEGAAVRMTDASSSGNTEDLSGVLFECTGEWYRGEFAGVFIGNTAISFGFCQGEDVANRRLTFIFESKDDPQKNFSVIYESGWTDVKSGRGRSGVYIKYGDQIRTSRYWQSDKNATDPNAWQNNENFNVDEALASPMFGGEGEFIEEFGKLNGTLSLEWTPDGVLEIYVSERQHSSSPRCIAAFDGTAGGVGFDPALSTWGLPRMDFSEGYTISFIMEVLSEKDNANATDMYFSQISTGLRGNEKNYSLAEEEMESVPEFYRRANERA